MNDLSVSNAVDTTGPTRLERLADRFARYAWVMLLVSVGLAVIGSVIVASIWEPDDAPGQPVANECENPPCFDLGGMPAASDLPIVIPTLGYVVAIVLGVPSLLAGIGGILRGRSTAGIRRTLVFIGLVVFFVGTEIIPHLLSPCWFVSGICEDVGGSRDVKDQWHLLDHTLVGAIPMTFLYWFTVRRKQ